MDRKCGGKISRHCKANQRITKAIQIAPILSLRDLLANRGNPNPTTLKLDSHNVPKLNQN